MDSYSSQTLDSIEYASELLSQARHAIILSGAGLSTPSGIPDFRSAGTGLWAHDKPLEVASLSTFRTHPEQFFNWFRPLAGQIYNAQPNQAHIAIAKLEQLGKLSAVLTQNIDLLHQRAGSKNVFELHGTLRTLSCTQCYKKFEYHDFLPAFIEDGKIPHCPECASVLKPDVILFGEQLPQKVLSDAQKLARECDLMIVIGSSLEVLPVASLPLIAVDRGAHLIIINNSPTYLNVRADIVLPEDVGRIIPEIVERVKYGNS